MIGMMISIFFHPILWRPIETKQTEKQETAIVQRLDQIDEDTELLAYTVQQEVGGLHDERATAAVVDVIYNRAEAQQCRLKDIITPEQFNGAYNYYTRKHPPDDLTWQVILHREQYRGITNGAKYFCSYDDLTGSAKQWFDSLQMTCQIDNMRFYRGK